MANLFNLYRILVTQIAIIIQDCLKDMDLQPAQILEPQLHFINILLTEIFRDHKSLNKRQKGNLFINRIDSEIEHMFSYLNSLFDVLCRKENNSSQHILRIPSIVKPAISDQSQFQIGHHTPNVKTFPKIQKRRFISREKHRGPYRSYTREEKNHVVFLHESGMKFASISKELCIPQKNVVRWCREGILEADSNKRLADSDMEKDLWRWIQKHPKRELLNYSDIQAKALKLSLNPQFKASRGWLKNFLNRYEHVNEKLTAGTKIEK